MYGRVSDLRQAAVCEEMEEGGTKKGSEGARDIEWSGEAGEGKRQEWKVEEARSECRRRGLS